MPVSTELGQADEKGPGARDGVRDRPRRRTDAPRKSVAPASRQPPERPADGALVPHDRDVGRPLGALAVEHRTVGGQHAVDLEAACGRLAGSRHLGGDRDRQADDDARRGRPAAAAASQMRGTVCSRSVCGPVIQVIVPSVSRPASASMRGASAATRIGQGVAPGTATFAAHAELVAGELTLPVADERSEHREVLAHVAVRLRERQPEHRFDHDLVRQPDAEA